MCIANISLKYETNFIQHENLLEETTTFNKWQINEEEYKHLSQIKKQLSHGPFTNTRELDISNLSSQQQKMLTFLVHIYKLSHKQTKGKPDYS